VVVEVSIVGAEEGLVLYFIMVATNFLQERPTLLQWDREDLEHQDHSLQITMEVQVQYQSVVVQLCFLQQEGVVEVQLHLMD